MTKSSKAKSTHQVGNRVKEKSKNGRDGNIVAAVGKARYKVKWDGEDAASDTEHANTALLVVTLPAAPDEAMGAAVEAGTEIESDGGSDDDGDQFDASREEDDHVRKRAAFEAHARSLDGEMQDVTVGA